MSSNKALIVLQENSGRVELPSGVPASLHDAIFAVIDGLAETFEDVKTTIQAANHYDVVHLLTDNLCSRKELLNTLVAETLKNRTIDLIVLGHGSAEKLVMKKKPDLKGGIDGNIRTLLNDAKSKPKHKKAIRNNGHTLNSFKFNLRMVYMCNCYGSTLNDDWIRIGAKVSIGSKRNNYMPEPMITFFTHNWLSGEKIKNAAKNAYTDTSFFYGLLYPPRTKITYKDIIVEYPCPTFTNLLKKCKKKIRVRKGVKFITNSKITDSKLIVSGNGNMVF